MKKTKPCVFWISMLILLGLLLTSCGFRESQKIDTHDTGNQLKQETQSLISIATETVKPTDPIGPDTFICQEEINARELQEPYHRHERDVPRFTLSADELFEFYGLLGIETICLPSQYGPPFINVDWNGEVIPATGRLVSIGFEDLYGGAGWSSAYLLYSTYDFSVGSEYDVFATQEDFINVQNGSIQNPITIDGINGFVRFHSGLPMGMQSLSKTYIFPFKDYYIAGVINVGAYDPNQIDAIVLEMEVGDHPDLNTLEINIMDMMISSIRFK